MCHSWRGKTQGHLAPTLNGTYNSIFNFKIIYMEKNTKRKQQRKKTKIKTKTREITSQQENDTENVTDKNRKKRCYTWFNLSSPNNKRLLSATECLVVQNEANEDYVTTFRTSISKGSHRNILTCSKLHCFLIKAHLTKENSASKLNF